MICAGACGFTAGANMLIDGVLSGATVTCAAGDTVIVRAISTTQFKLTRLKVDGTAQVSAAGGLTEVDAWKLTSPTSASGDLTVNLARDTYIGFSKLGVGMSQSSGIFSFPSIGLWEITFAIRGRSNHAATGEIHHSIDGSNFSNVKSASANPYTNRTDAIMIHTIFNVTSLTLCKVKFNCGYSEADSTYMIFKN